MNVEGRDIVVNNFERLSFNVGPTLLQWMETADPETYRRIIEADRASVERLGRGNAIAQAYHHTILPLSPLRDVRTQVRWGLTDFRHRFGRDAEGMWLPETATNNDVLDVLIEEGVRFTILAPWQGRAWRDPDDGWVDAEREPIETRLPHFYRHRDGSGRSLVLFFYDADIARQIAFEKAGASSERFVSLFEERATNGGLVHAATDGETYGHHHEFSELGLAYALFVEAEKRGLEVTNYGAFLDRIEVTREAALVAGAGSSWSCAHGVGRWAADCGCSTGGRDGWVQKWREPLRAALDLVKRSADETYDRLGWELFDDPWAARDEFIDVIVGRTEMPAFVSERASRRAGPDLASKMGQLLELQRNAMSIYTSCGWFFNDIAGIETVQILRYASRTIDLLEELGQPTPEAAFLRKLSEAKSNDPAKGTGADIYTSITPNSSAA
jgi:alpha-amylase/alpha-mannosidase (GH57 family)